MPSQKVKKEPRMQPAWLHVPEDRNPVLNPQPEDAEKLAKIEADRELSIDYLNKLAVGVPFKKTPPPPLLLSLVGTFLTEYGFHGAGRLYSIERDARKKIAGWNDTMGEKLPKSLPSLVIIFKEYHAKWEKEQELDTTSSEDESDESDESDEDDKKKEVAKTAKKSSAERKPDKKPTAAKSSSSGSGDSSSESSDEDVEMKDAPINTAKKTAALAANPSKRAASSSSSASGSSIASSSESDADDEKEVKAPKAPSPKPKSNGIKREARSSSSSGSSADSGSSSEDDVPAKVANGKGSNQKATKSLKSAVKTPLPPSESSSGSSSEDSSASESESGSDSDTDTDTSLKQLETKTKKDFSLPKLNGTLSSLRKNSTDSSMTVSGDATRKLLPQKAIETFSASSSSVVSSASESDSDSDSDSASDSDSDSESESDPSPSKQNPTILPAQTKRKRSPSPDPTPSTKKLKGGDATPKSVKTQNVPFSRIASDTKVDPKLASNQYVPYDYAERAHRDLSATKGKGFTKEKNKKKRGSYRGGTIDVEGRKGIKFED